MKLEALFVCRGEFLVNINMKFGCGGRRRENREGGSQGERRERGKEGPITLNLGPRSGREARVTPPYFVWGVVGGGSVYLAGAGEAEMSLTAKQMPRKSYPRIIHRATYLGLGSSSSDLRVSLFACS